jgi:hypothetical protein
MCAGTEVFFNAVLINSEAEIQFLATSVWLKKDQVLPNNSF